MFEFFRKLFDTSDFPARWYCGTWSDELGWMHITADLATFAAYTAMPCVITFFMLKRKDVEFPKVFWLFCAFIFACGTVHLIEATIFWQPWYRLSAVAKIVTAIVSWATVFTLIVMTPKALALPTLVAINARLATEIERRKSSERSVKEANDALELRVADRTKALRESEGRYLDLYDNAPDMFVSIDASTGRIVTCNRTLLDTLGYQKEEVIGKKAWELCAPESVERSQETFEEFSKTGIVRNRELTYLRSNGQPIDVSVKVTAVRDESGKILHSRSVIRDITLLKKVQEESARRLSDLAHLSRVAVMGEMATGIAHEINQPLYAISNYAKGARRRLENGPDDIEPIELALSQITQQAERAADTIRSLRRYVGKMDNELVVILPVELVANSIQILARELQDFKVTQEIQSDQSPIRCDAIQIEQVLINLLRNAIDSMSENDADSRVLTISVTQDEDSAQFSVQDRGTGINEEEIEKIFDAFYTSKADGMGMGLAISRTIIETHGGQMRASSDSEGTRMTFNLPGRPEDE